MYKYINLCDQSLIGVLKGKGKKLNYFTYLYDDSSALQWRLLFNGDCSSMATALQWRLLFNGDCSSMATPLQWRRFLKWRLSLPKQNNKKKQKNKKCINATFLLIN
jgi:hypothetical protein